MNPKVDFYFTKHARWQEAIEELRDLVLESGLAEELKWGTPCYTDAGRNIVLIHVFKEYCALLFFKGVLLKDPEQLLVQQTENVQSARQMRFTGAEEVREQAEIIQKYIREAVETERSGKKVPMKKTKEFEMPEEFRKALDEYPELQKAFKALTPGRQRGYLLHFSQAKQSATREARIEKNIPKILEGKGLNDA